MKAFIPVLVAGLTPFLVLSLIVSGIFLGLVAWQPPIYWSNQLGTSGSTNEVTAAVSDTNALYIGGFIGRPRTGYGPAPSPSYSFISKYDLSGHQVWMRQVGNPRFGQVTALMIGSDQLLVSEIINSTLSVWSYSDNGTQNWSSQIGASGTADSMTIGMTNIYVGRLGPAVQNGSSPIIVSQLDFNGAIVWTKPLASVGNQTGGNFALYSDHSELYVAGSGALALSDTHAFLSAFMSDGTLRWTRQFDQAPTFTCYCTPTGIVSDMTGIYIAGLTLDSFPGLAATGYGDLFILKYDPNGNNIWTREFSSPDFTQFGQPVVSDNSQTVYLGSSTGAAHGFIMKYNDKGELSWVLQEAQAPGAISAGVDAVFIGGANNDNGLAFIEQVGASSSLVIFGLNPPISFAIPALLLGSMVLSIIYFGRKRAKKPRQPTPPLRSSRVPADAKP